MKSIFTKIENMKVKTALFYACYLLFIVSAMTRCIIGFSDVANALSMISMALLCAMGLISLFRMPRKKAIIILFITLIVIATRIFSGTNTFLFLWLFIVSGKNISLEKILRYDLMIKIPLLIIVPIFYFAGLTEVNIHIRDEIVRHSMGFSNPNVFSTYVMSVVAEFLYLRRKKIKIRDVLFSVVMMLIVDYFADSRTQMIGILALAIAVYFAHFYTKKKRTKRCNNRIITLLINYSSFILMGASLLLSLSYMNAPSSEIHSAINGVFSGRVRAAAIMLEKYEPTLFGQELKIVTTAQSKKTGEPVQNLDNVYMYMLLAFGFVPTLIFCYFMTKYMKKTESHSITLRYIMLIYMICGLMEHFAIELQFNIFLLYFADLIYNYDKKVVNNDIAFLSDGR